jgi:hypothetical protein
MVTTIQNPGLSAAPAIVTLDPDAGTVISSASTTSASFTATASPRPQTVLWYLDGAQRTPASFVTPDKWLWTWDFGPVTLTGDRPAAGELVDGTYTVAAKAFDRYGQSGSGRSVTITVDRRRPFAPRNFVAGRNGEVVDLAWTANPERDLRGYEVYRLDEAGQPTSPPVCALTSRTSCQDTAPPATKLSDPTDDLRYVVFAVDGGVGKGDRSSVATAVDVNRPPNPPASLAATRFEGKVKLVWSRPEPEDPDDDPCSAPTADDPTPRRICYFTIYRDGELLANRYDRTATGEDLTWTDPGADAASHTYYVASVDRHLAESVKVGAVSP